MKICTQHLLYATACLIAFSALGCGTFAQKKSDLFDSSSKAEKSLMDRLPWMGKSEDEVVPYPNPVKIAATWTPDTLVQMGRTPTRGFGGRVFFYDEKSRPVPVEGTLIVHGFNDAAEDPKDRVKRFEFTPEQFTRHFSQTDLGASYSVWIPWDAIGGDQTRISLVTSFKTAEGKMVQGTPAMMVLPGRVNENEQIEKIAETSSQYRKHIAAAQAGSTRTSGLTTTTIARRRGRNSTAEGTPGITIPKAPKEKPTMIATGEGTPSFDLEMRRRPMRSTIRPASANLPVQR